jgi:hypothetical protein
VLELPRSALLTAWGAAALDGRVGVATAVRAVTGDDGPHTVAAADRSSVTATDLSELLVALRAAPVRGLRLVLPVPGDALGLPGPAEFNRAALEAGECVLTEPVPAGGSAGGVAGGSAAGEGSRVAGGDPPAWGLVPEVTTYGSVWEPGHLVTWRVRRVAPRRVTDVGSVREAERELREAMREATEALARLDVARWREDAAARVAGVRDGGLPAGALPPGTPPRCVQVLATAARVHAIVALAGEDDGAAVSGWEAQRRAQALRGLEAVARRAVVAAVNGVLEPG